MTREEASFILANIDRRVCDDELSEALDMAIKALEQEPKMGHGRLIDADKLRSEYTKPNLVGYDEIIADIDRQPTVVEGDGIWSDK